MHILWPLALSVAGLWSGSFQAPDASKPTAVELHIEGVTKDGTLQGSLAVPGDHSPLSGTFDARTGKLVFETDFDDDELIFVELALQENAALIGEISKGALHIPMQLSREDSPAQFFHDSGLSQPDDLPVAVVRSLLDDDLGAAIQELILEALRESNAVGTAVAIVRDGELADVRCVGWEDLAQRIPASASTRYRWASVAKPMTAVAALQLVEAGQLDLLRDIRDLVPEFPDKGQKINMHQLLAHHGGILHYGNGEWIPLEREYDVPHPWADRILSLDRFAASPLIARPGERYSYSTFGYMLAGALIERAGGASFEKQITERILRPLGMSSTEPDYPWVSIPHRAVGYRGLRIGLATLDEDLDVSWKLPAGGWISTIEDLGRFAAGLLTGELLEPQTQELMFTSQIPDDGRNPYYGYGIGTYPFEGTHVVSHSGEQSKASTYLLLCPDLGIGVCVLSNTANLPTGKLAKDLFRLLRSS